MKLYKYLVNIFLISLVLLVACKKDNDPVDKIIDLVKPKNGDTIPKYVRTANVYVAGSTYDSITYVRQAVYWKNEVPVILTNGTQNAAVNAIAVEGNDVYAAGYTTSANGAYIATYWKNGVQTNLTTNSTNASAGRIVVQGNDVYITGFVESNAVYWKNGEQVTLPLLPEMYTGSCAGIAVNGADIYVSGYQVGSKATAVLWKNKVPTKLPNDSACYAGKNIVFQDGQLYMPASYLKNYSKNAVINYWKNSVPVSLANDTVAVNALEIAINGADVFVACNTSKGAGYFKNGKLNLLSKQHTEMTGIAILADEVYSSGQSTNQNKSVATFWKNKLPVYLASPIGKEGFASAIVVKPL